MHLKKRQENVLILRDKISVNLFGRLICWILYTGFWIVQEKDFKKYTLSFYTFSTVINRVIRISLYLWALNNQRYEIMMRKLKITELNRMTVDEFKQADKLPLVVVLDEVRSLHNIGSVFRTSDAFLVNRIYLCGITATPPHPEMHKTALGAEDTVDWIYKKHTLEAVEELHNEGYTVLAIEQVEGSTMLDNLSLDPDKKYAIVMGNEVKGVQQEVVNACDGCIEIPQYGTKHSLNVSVTTGIVLWEFAKRMI